MDSKRPQFPKSSKMQPLPHVRPFYRFAATGLGASMWFFVCRPVYISHEPVLTFSAVDVPREARWYGQLLTLKQRNLTYR